MQGKALHTLTWKDLIGRWLVEKKGQWLYELLINADGSYSFIDHTKNPRTLEDGTIEEERNEDLNLLLKLGDRGLCVWGLDQDRNGFLVPLGQGLLNFRLIKGGSKNGEE